MSRTHRTHDVTTRPSDRELLQQFAENGRHDAFDELTDRHYGMVLQACRQWLPHRPDAEDAAQNTFLRLLGLAGVRKWREDIGPWLREMASQTARNSARAIRSRSRRHTPLTTEPPATPNDRVDWDELEMLETALAKLKPVLRTAVVLRHIDGVPPPEAAKLTGCSERTIAYRVRQGLVELRKHITGLPKQVFVLLATVWGVGRGLAGQLLRRRPGAAHETSSVNQSTSLCLCGGIACVLVGSHPVPLERNKLAPRKVPPQISASLEVAPPPRPGAPALKFVKVTGRVLAISDGGRFTVQLDYPKADFIGTWDLLGVRCPTERDGNPALARKLNQQFWPGLVQQLAGRDVEIEFPEAVWPDLSAKDGPRALAGVVIRLPWERQPCLNVYLARAGVVEAVFVPGFHLNGMLTDAEQDARRKKLRMWAVEE